METSRRYPPRRGGFTLVELLMVIALIGLIMGAAVLAFQGATGGASMRGASMQIRTALSLARQWAITHREITYVVFPETGTNQYHSLNIYTDSDGYLREWMLLPKGVIFNRQPADSVFAMGPTRVFSSGTHRYIAFRADGSVIGPADDTSSIALHMTEGFTTPSYSLVQNAPTNTVVISGMTGVIKTL